MANELDIKIEKTLGQIPSVLDKNTIYFNLINNEVEVYVSDMNGTSVTPVSSKKSYDNVTYSKVVSPGSEMTIYITDHDKNKTYNVSCLSGYIDIPIDSQNEYYGNVIFYTAPNSVGVDTITINDLSLTINTVDEVIDKPVILSPINPYNSLVELGVINLQLVVSKYNNSVPNSSLKNVYVKIIDPIFNPSYNEDWKSFTINSNDIVYDVITGSTVINIGNLYSNDFPNGRFEISIMYESISGVKSLYSDIFYLNYNKPAAILNYIPVLDSSYPLVSPNNLGIYPGNLSLRISQDYLFSNPEIGQLVYHYLQVSRDFEFINTIIDSDTFSIDLSNNVIDISNALDYNTTFYARVYCKFSNIDAFSLWSGVQTFTTSPMKPIENPLILSFGTIAGTNRIRATLSSFTEYYRSYHGYTQWQIATDSNFTNLVYDLNGINGYFTDFDSINANLNYSTGYFLRARWYDNNGRVSDWSGLEYIVTEPNPVQSVLKIQFESGIVDISGSNKTINENNSPSISNVQFYKGTKSLYLNGINQYLSIPSHDDFNIYKNDFTIRISAYKTADSIGGVLIGRQEASNNAVLQLTIGNNNKLYGFVRESGGNNFVALSSPTNIITSENWFTYALIRKNNVLMLYINGYVVSASNNVITNIDMNRPLTIGVLDDTLLTSYFKGYIDNVDIIKDKAVIDLDDNPLYIFKYKVYATNGLFINEFNDFSDMLVWYCNYWNSGSTVGDVSVTISDINSGNGNILYDINSTIYGTRLGVIECVKIPK